MACTLCYFHLDGIKTFIWPHFEEESDGKESDGKESDGKDRFRIE